MYSLGSFFQHDWLTWTPEVYNNAAEDTVSSDSGTDNKFASDENDVEEVSRKPLLVKGNFVDPNIVPGFKYRVFHAVSCKPLFEVSFLCFV